ncbi:L-threonine O-3-phosphate decarboxylase [Scopulibacillus darangshiensis]|uniref:threonine-phosphate decarboxylase n=1 Tax=Scopulibacillus darangshiensis TaxID=442528 RepID=A0A4R2PAF5_9BACL|nr:threonine-phosphate decarboxylase CobD [Scopulibacillus darangshiensis]TCP31254.1 L-threonine O-3-phosphate decarboxylase [Scopulibacillus darangshiensis]
MKLPAHGANPTHLLEALGLEQTNHALDFSVNINPLGPPAILKTVWHELYQHISGYPDPNARELRDLISQETGLKSTQILAGNGAAELIQLLARFLTGSEVLVVDPTFSEYASSCKSLHCRIESFALSEKERWQLRADLILPHLQGKRALFLCHPNNPTGAIYSYSEILKLIQGAQKAGVMVIIDEAFYDFCENDITVAPLVKLYKNLIVLRSLTKMYAIAGIRLGYLLADEQVINKLKACQPQWSVNALAQSIGKMCIQDQEHRKTTVDYIAQERDRVTTRLRELDYVISDSSVNYFLFRDRKKQRLDHLIVYLIKNGVIPRHTANFITLDNQYLRFSIKMKEENDQLLAILEKWRYDSFVDKRV